MKFPLREFIAKLDEFVADREPVPAFKEPRDAPPAGELPANDREFEAPAPVLPAFTPARVPAVLPVLRATFAPELPPELPENECQLPSAFARVAPRPMGQPEVRAFKVLERPAFEEFERPAFEAAPLCAFSDRLPPERPAFMPPLRPPP